MKMFNRSTKVVLAITPGFAQLLRQTLKNKHT